MNLDNVAEAIAKALRTIPNLNVYETIPASVRPPSALVSFGPGRNDQTFAAAQTVQWQIAVIVSKANFSGAQKAIRSFCAPPGQSDNSLVAVLEVDPSLDGEVGSIAVIDWDAPEQVEVAGVSYVQVVFNVETID